MNQNGTPNTYQYPPANQQHTTRLGVQKQPVQTPSPVQPAVPYNGGNLYYQQAPQTVVPEPPKKKRGKAKIIVIVVLVVLLALIIGGTVLFFTSPAYSVRRDMKKEDYSDAMDTYEEDVEDHFIQELLLKLLLKDYDVSVVDQFKNEKIEYESAIEALVALDEMGFEQAEDKLVEIEAVQAEHTAFESGKTYAQTSDYENAIKEFSKIGESSEQYKDAQQQLDNLYPQYVVYVVEQVKAYTQTKEYAKAMEFVNTAYSILPQGEYTDKLDQVKTTCQTSYKTYVTNQITELLAEQEYEEAISVINGAIAVYDNEDFQQSKKTVVSKYVNSVTQKVNKYLKKEDYVTAKRVADKAVTVLPNNSALVALQGKVQRATPTYLLDKHSAYSSSQYTPCVNGELMYMGGKSYTNGFLLDDDPGNAVFNIEGLYDTLRFTVGHVDNTDKNSVRIKVYCDGVMKKEITMDAEDLPRKVALDVTGVKQLKFEVNWIDGWGSKYGFANVTVK